MHAECAKIIHLQFDKLKKNILTIFKGYFPFVVTTKYWLYSHVRHYILLPIVCASDSATPVLSPQHW